MTSYQTGGRPPQDDFLSRLDAAERSDEAQATGLFDLQTALSKMRLEAMHKRLDMTDAFEEMVGKAMEKAVGTMDKARFKSTLGMLFRGEALRCGC